jgi:tRNA-dihydrouridine synthase
MLEMRRHYANYLKGLPHVKEYRMRLVTTLDPAELENIFEEMLEHYSAQVY